MSKESGGYCYSWDDEMFNSGTFTSVEDALHDAATENDDGHTHVFIAESKPHVNSRFFPDADTIIEYMQDQADCVAGEYANDYPDVGAEAREDLTEQLSELLERWCTKHEVSPTFYAVENSKQYPVSELV